MRAVDFITEIGNRPYRLPHPNKYGQSIGILPDGREFRINFERLDFDTVLFSFSVDDEVGITGGGDAVRILSTVSAALNNYVGLNYPQLIVWAAKIRETSRIKLYDRFAERFLSLSNLSNYYVNLTNRTDLWPNDLEQRVTEMHGRDLKIYVLASFEYMDYVRSASDTED